MSIVSIRRQIHLFLAHRLRLSMLYLVSYLYLLLHLVNLTRSMSRTARTIPHLPVERFDIPEFAPFIQQDCSDLLNPFRVKSWFSIDIAFGPSEPPPGTTPVLLTSGTRYSRITALSRATVTGETIRLSNHLGVLQRIISVGRPARGSSVRATGVGFQI